MEENQYNFPLKENEESLSISPKKHQHKFIEVGNELICQCGMSKLNLKKTEIEGLFKGVRKNGSPYSVRADRLRYFTPEEWIIFKKVLRKKHLILFDTLLQTGGRIDEVLNIKPKDFIWEQKTIRLRVTKVRAKKQETRLLGGRQRSFVVSSTYIKKMKNHIRENKIGEDDKIFPMTSQAVSQLFKRALQRAKLPYWEFSLHNIRKTSGMWLKTVQRRGDDLDISEICMRLGHDYNTFLKHYGSPSVFTDRQRDMIVEIFGDIYNLR